MTALEALNLGRQHGISPAAMHPLLALVEDSPLSPSELCQRIGTSKANITGLLDRLVRDGWVTRTPSTDDRRQWVLVPTLKAFETLSPSIEEEP
jgi:DNA-binding MarR family transcriptional regulator